MPVFNLKCLSWTDSTGITVQQKVNTNLFHINKQLTGIVNKKLASWVPVTFHTHIHLKYLFPKPSLQYYITKYFPHITETCGIFSPGCLINQEFSVGTGRVCGRSGGVGPHELWGQIDAVKVIIRLWMLVRLWVKGTWCHWLRPGSSHMLIPTDPPQLPKRTAYVTFPLAPAERGGFQCHNGGWRDKDRGKWAESHKIHR